MVKDILVLAGNAERKYRVPSKVLLKIPSTN
jgi:hypothetical protein